MSANLKLHDNVGGITEKSEGKYEHDFSSLYQGWTQIGKNAKKSLKSDSHLAKKVSLFASMKAL